MRSHWLAGAVLAAACMELPAARYRCDNGECPAGLVCSPDLYCVDPVAAGDGGEEPDAGNSVDLSALCEGVWCWEHPQPTGRVTFRGVHEIAPDDVWVCGYGGNLLHFDGRRWQSVPTGTNANLNRVWASGPGDVWAVGEYGTVLHWNGTALTTVDAGVTVTLRGLAGLAADAIWAVGSSGTVLKYDGRSWTRQVVPGTTGTLYDVEPWTSAKALAVGDSVIQWNGAAWTAAAHPAPGTSLYGVWSVSDKEVWTYGANGGVFHAKGGSFDDAGSWSAADSGTTSSVHVMFGFDPEHRYWGNGSSSYGLWELSGGQVTQVSTESTYAIHGLSPSDLWAVGRRSILHRTAPATVFEDHHVDPVWENELQAVVQTADGTDWVVGDNHLVLVRSDGGWRQVAVERDPTWGQFYDVWAGPSGEVIAVGGDPVKAAYWDAGAFSVINGLSAPADINSVWGDGTGTLWLVGDQGYVAVWDGGAWAEEYNALLPGYEAVWGTSRDDVWIAGLNGVAVHWDGGSRMFSILPTGQSIYSLTGLGQDVFIGTGNGDVFRFANGTWVNDNAPQGLSRIDKLLAFEGRLYLASDDGTIAVREGGQWRVLPVPVDSSLGEGAINGISGMAGRGMIAVGAYGAILRRR
jgi:hypothetical protein